MMRLPPLRNGVYYGIRFFSLIHGMGLHFGRKFLLKQSTGKYAEPQVGKIDYFNDIIP